MKATIRFGFCIREFLCQPKSGREDAEPSSMVVTAGRNSEHSSILEGWGLRNAEKPSQFAATAFRFKVS